MLSELLAAAVGNSPKSPAILSVARTVYGADFLLSRIAAEYFHATAAGQCRVVSAVRHLVE
jgi:hypothetical protein